LEIFLIADGGFCHRPILGDRWVIGGSSQPCRRHQSTLARPRYPPAEGATNGKQHQDTPTPECFGLRTFWPARNVAAKLCDKKRTPRWTPCSAGFVVYTCWPRYHTNVISAFLRSALSKPR